MNVGIQNVVQVLVTLKYKADSGFEFLNSNGTVIKSKSRLSHSSFFAQFYVFKFRNVAKNGYNTRQITVPGGGGRKAVYFPIILTKVSAQTTLIFLTFLWNFRWE